MRAVIAVGVRGPVPRVGGAEVTVLPLHRLKEAGYPRRGGTLLLLGVDALRRIPPARVQKLIRFPYGIAVGILGPGLDGLLDAWNEAGIAVVSPGAALQGRLESLARMESRIPVPPEAWVPPGVHADPALKHAVLVLPRCPKLDVENWAAELGVERHFLNRRFRKSVGVRARDVCREYLVEYTARERSRKIPWPMLAAVLGYPNGSNLRRAVSAPRRAPPVGSRRSVVPD